MTARPYHKVMVKSTFVDQSFSIPPPLHRTEFTIDIFAVFQKDAPRAIEYRPQYAKALTKPEKFHVAKAASCQRRRVIVLLPDVGADLFPKGGRHPPSRRERYSSRNWTKLFVEREWRRINARKRLTAPRL
jgi:hypothetical protein